MDIKRIIQKNKNGGTDTMMWSAIVSMIQKEVKEMIDSKETEISSDLRKYLKEMTDGLDKWSSDVKSKAEIKVENYINSKKLEIKGEKGDPGESIVGPKGAKGDTGKGEKGDRGESAVVDYERVKRDVLGLIGDLKEKGNEIIAKINNSSDKILVSSIQGLRQELDELRRAIKEIPRSQKGGTGGGGMGNTQHESKSVSSATTTVQTTYPISANGYAIMGAFYQGQMIARGVGYTVGTDKRTLTLLFTPVDGTFIDLVYIR